MTDLRKAAEDLLEGVEAAIKAGDWKVDGACDPDSAIVRLRQALAHEESEVTRLRQVCRNVYEVWAGSEGTPMPETCAEGYLLQLVEQMRDEAKEGLHVDAVNMSQERVDETAKREHDLVYRLRKRAEIRRQIDTRKSVQEGKPDRIADLLEEAADYIEKREWVGLTDSDKQEAFDETQEASSGFWEFADYLEAKLKEKNNG